MENKQTLLTNQISDKYQRPLRDLRISVTDRCNFRCVYCMPKEVFNHKHKFLPRVELLSFEEIERLVRCYAGLGVSKIRFTGGEPLLRKNLPDLIESVAAVEGIKDISLTTNASLMTYDMAKSLRDAGLNRINVSLDALDDDSFQKINDVGISVGHVLAGIENADKAGIETIKINMVVKSELNGHSLVPMARYFHGSRYILRFIEFMDVGNHNGWDKKAVISAKEMVEMIHRELPIEPMEPNYTGEVAQRWRYLDGGGELGIISSITQPFCGDCHRARLSAVGQLFTCLFASSGHDLRALLRSGATDTDLREYAENIWLERADRYSEQRSESPIVFRPKVEMSYIGG